MRFELGSPRKLLALVGLIMILFVFAQKSSSALLGAVLVIGVILIIASGIWAVVRSPRQTNH